MRPPSRDASTMALPEPATSLPEPATSLPEPPMTLSETPMSLPERPVSFSQRHISCSELNARLAWREGQQQQQQQQQQPQLQDSAGEGDAQAHGSVVTWLRSLLQSLHGDAKVALEVTRAHPSIAVLPALVFCLVVALGVFGIVAAANNEVQNRRADALAVAKDTAMGFKLQLESMFAPVISMATLVKHQPVFSELAPDYDKIAAELLNQLPPGTTQELQVSPFGVVAVVYPPVPARVGSNTFTEPLLRPGAMAALAVGSLSLSGPQLQLPTGGFSGVLRNPVFMQNVSADEAWGQNRSSAANCSICYNSTSRTKFWGFVTAVIHFESLTDGQDSRMLALAAKGYLYRMTRPSTAPLPPDNNNSAPIVITQSTRAPDDPVTADISVAHQSLTLAVQPSEGWRPSWEGPMIALDVLVAALLACLLFAFMYSMKRHMLLLHSMLPDKVVSKLRSGKNFYEAFDTVTILFADIVSYTTMVSQMSPLKVVNLLNEVYSEFDDLVAKHDVYKVETIGDCIMVVGGCPTSEDPGAAAAKVARLAQDMVCKAAAFVSRDGLRIRIRVGIHSGSVVASVVGKKMPRYCLFGDTVNTASRMESHGAPMRIHVSAATAELLLGQGGTVALMAPAPPPPSPDVTCTPLLLKGAADVSLKLPDAVPAAGCKSASVELIVDPQNLAGGVHPPGPPGAQLLPRAGATDPQRVGWWGRLQARCHRCSAAPCSCDQPAGGPMPAASTASGSTAAPFLLQPRGEIDVKGKGCMSTYWLLTESVFMRQDTLPRQDAALAAADLAPSAAAPAGA